MEGCSRLQVTSSSHLCPCPPLRAGRNEFGQLADGTTNQQLTPNLVASNAPFKAIASGPSAHHTLFLQASLWCFCGLGDHVLWGVC